MASFPAVTVHDLDFQACMFMSSIYHTFTAHSRTVSEKCLALDMAGITLALLATYLSGVYYSFYCQPEIRDFYLATVAGIFAIAAGAQFYPKFTDESYGWIRVTLFVLWSAYGIVPTIHFVYVHGLESSLIIAVLPRILAMYAIFGAAFLIYFFQ